MSLKKAHQLVSSFCIIDPTLYTALGPVGVMQGTALFIPGSLVLVQEARDLLATMPADLKPITSEIDLMLQREQESWASDA